MKVTARVVTALLFFSLCTTVQANRYGSVEPIANTAVIDTGPLTDQPLEVREAFARRLLQCGERFLRRIAAAAERSRIAQRGYTVMYREFDGGHEVPESTAREAIGGVIGQ
jgi:hypothetical protein